MGLYNVNGQRRVTLVSGSTRTGIQALDGSFNAVAGDGVTPKGLYHACGGYNVTVATTPQSTIQAPDGSYYVYLGVDGYVLPGGAVNTTSVLPSWVINSSNPPDVAIDFMNNRAFLETSATPTAASVITCGRASPQNDYVNNAAGTWTAVAPNVPRISDLGLLVEENRTNSLITSSTTGAVAGAIGAGGAMPNNWNVANTSGATVTVGTPTTVNGVEVVPVTFSGTVTSTGNVSIVILTLTTAAQNDTWSGSIFAQLTAGTPLRAISTELDQLTSVGGFISGNQIPMVPTATLQRFTNIFFFNQATVGKPRWLLQFAMTNGDTPNFTVNIGWPQLELGASVTSPIRTTAAAVTRAADIVTLTTPPTFGSSYSIFGKGTPLTPVTYAANAPIVSVDDGTLTNRATPFRATATGIAGILAASTASGIFCNAGMIGNPVHAQNASGKYGTAFAPLDQAGSFNGSAAATNATGTPATGALTIHIGARADTLIFWNGFIEYSAIWPTQRVPNAQLVSMTT